MYNWMCERRQRNYFSWIESDTPFLPAVTQPIVNVMDKGREKKRNRSNSRRCQDNIWNSPTFTPCANGIYSGAKGLWKSPIWLKIATPDLTLLPSTFVAVFVTLQFSDLVPYVLILKTFHIKKPCPRMGVSPSAPIIYAYLCVHSP